MPLNCELAIITNNRLNNSFSTGITVVNRQSEGAIIMNNQVDSSGMWLGQGVTMASSQLRGISFGADSFRTQRYTFCSRNVVRWVGHAGIRFEGSNLFIDSNYVTNYCQQLQDNGGIYSWQGNGGKSYVNRYINWNIIDSCFGITNLKTPIANTNRDVAGLYFDDMLKSIIAQNNTVANIIGIGVQFNTSQGISIRNTTLWKDSTAMLINQKAGVAMTNVSINNNVVYNPNAIYLHDYILDRNPDVTTASLLSNLSLDSNVYSTKAAGYKTDQSAKVSGPIMPNTTTNLATWKTKTGKDANSTETTGTAYFIYNSTLSAAAFSLPAGGWRNIKTGTTYVGSITLQGMASAVLLNYLVVDAGADQTITLPTNTVHVISVPAGGVTPYTYLWTKISGPASYSILSPTVSQTDINSLTAGTYQFKIVVSDAAGGTAADTVQITVNQSPNNPPVANAGNDTTITLPASSANLNASLSTDDGGIASYLWTKISGPTGGTITNPSSVSTTVTGLTQGTYIYQVLVTDNFGATGTATKQIIVNPALIPPVARAGNDTTVTLPANSAVLNGSTSTDADGTITTYLWAKLSGPSAGTITNANLPTTSITGMVQGTYVISLQVTDNNGLTNTDTKQIIVNPAIPPVNIPPTADAGSNSTITLPTSTAPLNGSGSTDPDGTIVSYLWVKISGPATGSVSSPTSAITTAINLVAGNYVFRLKVVDNNGDSGIANKTVTVNPAPNVPPTADAGSNTTITLPTSTAPLNASGSTDPDGTIVAYLWTKISGPTTFTITSPTSAITTATGLVVGTYVFRVRVTDNNGDTGISSKTVLVNPVVIPPLVVSLNSSNLTCYSNATGSITSSVSGGVPSYSYLWTPGNQTTSSITGQVAGGYSLRVTDANGSVINTATSLTQPDSITVNASYGTITSPSGTTTVNVFAYGGTGTLTGTGAFTGIDTGYHLFTVTDANGCTGQVAIYLTVTTSPIVLTLTPNTLSCNGDQDGEITSSHTGGTAPFSYQWNALSGTGNVTSSDTFPDISGLTAGTYELIVTDVLGQSVAGVAVISEPQVIQVTPSAGTITYQGGSTTVTVTSTGGTGAKTYSGAGTQVTSGVFTGVLAGTYTYSATDANGCTQSATITIPDGAVRPPAKKYKIRKY